MATKISNQKMLELAQLVEHFIKWNFQTAYQSGNLRDTTYIAPNSNGYSINVPAQRYDENIWRERKAIVYTHNGSYAQQVDYTGGYSGKHIEYVEIAINLAIQQWANENGYDIEVKIK